MKLKGTVAIVTGASKGIGRCIAETFAREGCSLTIVSRNLEEIVAAGKEIEKHGVDVLALKCDVSQQEDVKGMVDATIEKYGKIDILVNNAGIYGPLGPFVDNSPEDWRQTIEINLLGTVNCARFVLPHMIAARKGKIINLSGGGAGGPPTPTLSAYFTSKVAVAAFTEILAVEVKEFNIQVNAIAPGAVNTRLLDQVLAAADKVDRKFLEKSIQQKETGGIPPQKAADLALFLASDESDGITGKLLSAVWDDYRSFSKLPESIRSSSIYTLRRIDEKLFKEVQS
ncbi:MAG: SDR family NAD(P)-dependent oxidoreductase [Candidatus Hadarchaeales archaeon]